MQNYVVLLRGINVGGKNKMPMAALRRGLEVQGFENVATYIQSGNVLLRSGLDAQAIGATVEQLLVDNFALDSALIRVLVLSEQQLQAVIDGKPAGFGDEPEKYYSDVIFLMGIASDEAMAVFDPRDGVDQIWAGPGVVYSQRLSALRTQSRLNKIIGTPAYQSMTIRNWNTTTKLLALLQQH